jgi:hypothetical protein
MDQVVLVAQVVMLATQELKVIRVNQEPMVLAVLVAQVVMLATQEHKEMLETLV